MDKPDLLEIRGAILDALAFIETLRRGPDGEHGNGGMELQPLQDTARPPATGAS